MLEIPVSRSAANQSVFVNLDGRSFELVLYWNARIERWFISINSSDGTRLLSNKALLNGASVLPKTRWNAELPAGLLSVYEAQELGSEATLESLGVNHKLVFIPDNA